MHATVTNHSSLTSDVSSPLRDEHVPLSHAVIQRQHTSCKCTYTPPQSGPLSPETLSPELCSPGRTSSVTSVDSLDGQVQQLSFYTANASSTVAQCEGTSRPLSMPPTTSSMSNSWYDYTSADSPSFGSLCKRSQDKRSQLSLHTQVAHQTHIAHQTMPPVSQPLTSTSSSFLHTYPSSHTSILTTSAAARSGDKGLEGPVSSADMRNVCSADIRNVSSPDMRNLRVYSPRELVVQDRPLQSFSLT